MRNQDDFSECLRFNIPRGGIKIGNSLLGPTPFLSSYCVKRFHQPGLGWLFRENEELRSERSVKEMVYLPRSRGDQGYISVFTLLSSLVRVLERRCARCAFIKIMRISFSFFFFQRVTIKFILLKLLSKNSISIFQRTFFNFEKLSSTRYG